MDWVALSAGWCGSECVEYSATENKSLSNAFLNESVFFLNKLLHLP